MDENAMDIGTFKAIISELGTEAAQNRITHDFMDKANAVGITAVRVVTPEGTYNINNVELSEDGLSINIVVLEAEE